MAAYEKKKRGFFGKFSGFPDDNSKSPGEQSSGYTRLEKVKSALKGSWSRTEESVDELASNTLLGGRSQKVASSIELGSYKLPEGVGVPVPPVPPVSSTDQHRSLPTRNAKPKLGRKGDKERVRPVISNPTLLGPGPKFSTRPIVSSPMAQEANSSQTGMLHDDGGVPTFISNPTLLGPGPQFATRPINSSPMAKEANSSQTGMLHDDGGARPKDIASPGFTAADAEAISRKIEMLNNQQSVEKPLRLSPYQRGKAVVVKATRAVVAVRINSNHRHGTSKQAVPNVEEGTPPSSISSESNVNEGSPTRIDLRIAEGTNLAKEKVQAFMGDGYIKRKPLPGTEKKRAPTPESEDPQSDAKVAMLLGLGTPGFSGFNFNFESNEAQRNSTHLSSQRNSRISRNSFAGGSPSEFESPVAPSHSRSSLEEPAETEAFSSSPVEFSTPLVGSSGSFGFSDSVSGLAQHPDVLTFATPPTDVSTPRVRSERAHIPNKQKRSRAVLMRDPSISNVGFENGGEDYAPLVAPRSGPSPLRTSSIKRTVIEPQSNRSTLKKTKRDSIVSDDLTEEEAALITGFDRLDTEDRQALFPPLHQRHIPSIPERPAPRLPEHHVPQLHGRYLPPMSQRPAQLLPQHHLPLLPQRHVAQIRQRHVAQLGQHGVPCIPQRPAPSLPQRYVAPVPGRPGPPLPQRRVAQTDASAPRRRAPAFSYTERNS